MEDDWWGSASNDIQSFFEDILHVADNSISLIKSLPEKIVSVFRAVGQFPKLLEDMLPFIPSEIWSVISLGLLLYFAPAIIAGIKGITTGIVSIASGLGNVVKNVISFLTGGGT